MEEVQHVQLCLYVFDICLVLIVCPLRLVDVQLAPQLVEVCCVLVIFLLLLVEPQVYPEAGAIRSVHNVPIGSVLRPNLIFGFCLSMA